MGNFNIKEWQDKHLNETRDKNKNFMPKQRYWDDEFIFGDKMTYFGYEVHPQSENPRPGEYLVDIERNGQDFDDVFAVIEKVKGIAVYTKYVTGKKKGKKEIYDLAALIKTGEYKGTMKNERKKMKYKGKTVYYGIFMNTLYLKKFGGLEIPTRASFFLPPHDEKISKRREVDSLLKSDIKNKRFKV